MRRINGLKIFFAFVVGMVIEACIIHPQIEPIDPLTTYYSLYGVVSIQPPDYYRMLFFNASRCSGTYEMEFDDIEWFAVDSIISKTTEPNNPELAGVYNDSRIFLVTKFMNNHRIVKHEILHYLGFSHQHAILWYCASR